MNVNPILTAEDIKKPTWINALLSKYGVEDVERWREAGKADLQSPTIYPNIDEAVRLIEENKNKRWAVVVDPDNDGYCSATIAYCFLKSIGATPVPFFHTGKQHGLEPTLVEKIVTTDPKIEAVWLPDAGSNEVDGCQKLAEAGMVILVSDHHEITKENKYAVIVNNCAKNGVGLNQNLSGTGVTAKVVEHYCATYNLPVPDMTALVAVSIISDDCSFLSQENKAYINMAFGGEADE